MLQQHCVDVSQSKFFLIDTHYTHVRFTLLIPFFLLLYGTYIVHYFFLQFRDFFLTPYAPAPASAPAHAPAAAPASAPATGSAGHAHGLEASEEVPHRHLS
jgi:hypothetical protein